MKESDLLQKMTERLRRAGWIQIEAGNDTEGFCLFGVWDTVANEEPGACNIEWGGDHMGLGATGVAVDVWQRIADMLGEEPVDWNDREGRTVDEVYVLLEKAEEEARAEGQ